MHTLTSRVRDRRSAHTSLTLPFHLRQRSRQRVVLDNGEEAGLLLARGTVLNPGDRLLDEHDAFVVEVKAALETLSTVRVSGPLPLARACYHLGNRHVPLQIERDTVRYLHDPVLDQMLGALGLHVICEQAPFTPETGAYGNGHGHPHGH